MGLPLGIPFGENFGNYSSYIGINNFGWVSFYDFFERIKVLDDFKFKEYKKLIKSNAFNAYEYENFVFAIQPPTTITRDNEGRLHSVNSAAIEFKDKSFYHFIHGISVVPELWEKLQNKSYTFEDFVKEENEEIKSAVLSFMEEKWGGEYLFRFISDNLKEIDTYTDKKEEKYLEGTFKGMEVGVYTLYKGEINNIDLAFIRCYDYSTDRLFFLSVDPSNTNAKDAVGSMYRLPKKLIPHIKEILRQGENYTTLLSDEGHKIRKELSQKDIEDLQPISGNKYFSLLTYEY